MPRLQKCCGAFLSLNSLYFQQSKMYNNYKHTKHPGRNTNHDSRSCSNRKHCKTTLYPSGVNIRLYAPYPPSSRQWPLAQTISLISKGKQHIVVLFSHFLVISLSVDNHYVYHYSSHRLSLSFPRPLQAKYAQ